MNTRASRAVPIYIFSAPSFLCAKWHKFCFLCASLKFRHREKCFDFGTNRHRESLWANRSDVPPRDPSTRLPRARTFYMVLYILSLYPPHFVSLALLSFSAPSPRRPSFSLRFPRSPLVPLVLPSPVRPIRLIRVQKKIILVQKKFLSDSCANTPSKLSSALYKLCAKASTIPLKSRKTQIFSNFLSQSLARFRKSPYFCTR